MCYIDFVETTKFVCSESTAGRIFVLLLFLGYIFSFFLCRVGVDPDADFNIPVAQPEESSDAQNVSLESVLLFDELPVSCVLIE